MSASHATQGGHNKEYGDDTTKCIVYCVPFIVCSAYREKIGSAERHSLELVGRVHVCDSYLIFDTVERRDVYYRRPRPHQHRQLTPTPALWPRRLLKQAFDLLTAVWGPVLKVGPIRDTPNLLNDVCTPEKNPTIGLIFFS